MRKLFLSFFFFIPAFVGATSTGAILPGTGSDEATTGTVSWTTPNNITTIDSTYALIAFVSPGQVSHYLVGSGFTLGIPSNAVIDGMEASFVRDGTSGIVADSSVVLVIDASTSTDKVGGNWPASDTLITYGSPTDKWGLTVTPSNIVNIKFKMACFCNSLGGAGRVDYYTLAVYYHIGSSDFIAVSQNYFD